MFASEEALWDHDEAKHEGVRGGFRVKVEVEEEKWKEEEEGSEEGEVRFGGRGTGRSGM